MEALKPVKLNLAKKFRQSRSYRHEFFRARAKDEIAIQIRELREKRKLRQVDFAKQANMKQSAVSRIEQTDYSGWTFRTLMKVAEALDARLRIVFQPMEDVIAEYDSRERETGHTRRSVESAFPPVYQETAMLGARAMAFTPIAKPADVPGRVLLWSIAPTDPKIVEAHSPLGWAYGAIPPKSHPREHEAGFYRAIAGRTSSHDI